MNQAAIGPARQEIVVDEVFPHTAETIWRTLTTPELMARWLKMTPSGFAATIGNRFTYKTTPAGAWDGVIQCEVLEVMPNERLVYAWKGGHDENTGYGSRLETIVTWTLSKVANGTRLRLVHSGFALPRNEIAFRNMSGGWVGVLQRIDTISAEHDPSTP